MKLQLVPVPASDVDRARAFHTDQVGFVSDHDHQVADPGGNPWSLQQLPTPG